MADRRTHINVFVGSPTDVLAERGIVVKVADDINRLLGARVGVQIDVRRWEGTPPADEPPQSYIDRNLLDACDVFVGLLHQKWGTKTEKYSSGFLEEYEISKARWDATKFPKILIFFKSVVGVVPQWQLTSSQHPDLQKIFEFKRRLEEVDKFKHYEFASQE